MKKEKIIKQLYGITAFADILLMFWTQSLCESGTLSRGKFIACFILQFGVWVWCLYQCGAFENE